MPSERHWLSKGHSVFFSLGQLHYLVSGSCGFRILEFFAEIIWATLGVVEYPILTFYLLKTMCSGCYFSLILYQHHLTDR